MKKISICIPTIELKKCDGNDDGIYMLNFLLNTIKEQTYKNFEIVISDQSKTNIIKDECEKWTELDIKYFKNTNGIGSAVCNLNNAISKSNGEYIKPIFQDDFFYSNTSLEYIVKNLKDGEWGAVGTNHCIEDNMDTIINPISPKWICPIKMLGGENLISGPSVLFFKNDNNYLDNNLCWLNDVEFYYRLYLKYGKPILLPKQKIMQRLRKNSLSNTLNNRIKEKEKKYVLVKHSII